MPDSAHICQIYVKAIEGTECLMPFVEARQISGALLFRVGSPWVEKEAHPGAPCGGRGPRPGREEESASGKKEDRDHGDDLLNILQVLPDLPELIPGPFLTRIPVLHEEAHKALDLHHLPAG